MLTTQCILYTPSQNTNTEIQKYKYKTQGGKYKMHKNDKCSLHDVLLYTPSQNTKTEIQKIQIQNIGRETQKYKPTNAHYTLSYYTRHPRIQVPKYKNAQHKNNKKNNQIILS